MLFANDFILVNDIRDGPSRKLDVWMDALERKGDKISRTEIKFLICNFVL